ncbi:MAG: amino acid adenylation domain-containing protein [Lachnospiraceae bacterium]|nr:amino acid adenylation domain-containing protein [Lachnospiraceae bacterium]
MKISYKDGELCIIFEEKLDYDTALSADKEIADHLDRLSVENKAVNRIVIDAEKLDYISSAGIRILIKLKKKCHDLSITNVSDSVYEIISITGMEDILGLERTNAVKSSGDDTDDNKKTEAKTDINAAAKAAETDPDFISVIERFEEQVRLHPKKTAVISSNGSFTYEELNTAANRVANSLQYLGVGHGDIILIFLSRSIEMYAATIGVLKAGCAYVIADPLYPDPRIRYIHDNSGATHIISTRPMIYERLELFVDELTKRPLFYEDLMTNPNIKNPETEIVSSDLCYVIYTSGSTGNPKGVMIEHGNLANFLTDVPQNREYRAIVERSKRLLAMAAMTFDVSIMEEYIPLVSGNTVVLALMSEISDPSKMTKLMIDNEVDGAVFTPTYVAGLLKLSSAKEAIKRLKVADIGAEAFPASLLIKLKEVNPYLYIMNGYGPTETTISCTMKVMEDPEDITIGIPNANVYAYVVDEDNNEVKDGETGELIICGKGVGRGYLNLPDLTKKSFFTYKGMRAYKSGDICRITDDGEIEYIGRKDDQVKIRGLRIELSEVESLMGEMKGMNSCAAASIDGRYLCLYYVSETGITEEALRAYAKEHLAHYMHPDIYVKLNEMPMTDNMKIDRKALPKIKPEAKSHRQPETDIQRKLCEFLIQVTDYDDFGTDTDLIETGLSSLDVMLFITLIGDEYNIAVNVSDIVNNPTILRLEEFIISSPKRKKVKGLSRYHVPDVQVYDYLEAIAGNNDLDLPVLYVFDPSVDTQRLKEAVKTVIRVHPGLRARFEQDDDGIVWQIPQDDISDVEIPVIKSDDQELSDPIKYSSPTPPDAKWLFNFKIIECQNKKYLFADYNHLVTDGESINILTEDILSAYDGKELRKEKLPMTEYSEYIYGFFDTGAGRICKQNYRDLLSITGFCSMPEDHHEEPWSSAHYETVISDDGEAVRKYCAQKHISTSTLFSGILSVILAVQNDKKAGSFATLYTGRNDSGLTNTVGYISTVLLNFFELKKDDTVTGFLNRIKSTMFNMMMFPVMPLSDIMGIYPDMYDFIYCYQPYYPEDYEMDGKPVKVLDLQERAVYEKLKFIVQTFEKKDGSYTINLDYHANLFSAETVEGFAQDFKDILTMMLKEDDINKVIDTVGKRIRK